MNVKICLKLNNGLLYRTESTQIEGVRLYTTTGGARRVVGVARFSYGAASHACTHPQVVP
jgi:hypothetical protein